MTLTPFLNPFSPRPALYHCTRQGRASDCERVNVRKAVEMPHELFLVCSYPFLMPSIN